MASIFLVEDDRITHEFLSEALRQRGHSVLLEAFSKEEALQKTQEVRDLYIEVLILDGNLGTSKQDGKEVAAYYRKEVPGLRILALSGEEGTYGDVNCTKPLGIDELDEAIRHLLDMEIV